METNTDRRADTAKVHGKRVSEAGESQRGGRINDGRVASMAALPEARVSAAPTDPANRNKTVSVRMVYIDDDPARVDGPLTEYTINWWNTLQQAVRAMYPAFPGVCMWVVRRRGLDRVHLWERSQDAGAFDEQNFYPTLGSGDEIEIYVDNRQPRGPKASVSDGAGEPPRDGRSDRGHGPWCGPDGKHACVGCMLATLGQLG